MALTAAQFEQQKRQAEEILFSGPQKLGFAKGLFFGHFNGALLFPYPEFDTAEQAKVNRAVDEVRRFMTEQVDSTAIDRDADIPRDVIDGLARIGVLGMTAPSEVGGRGFSQMGSCKIMEVIGGQDASGVLGRIEEYDPNAIPSATWTAKASMPTPRRWLGVGRS